ncbi:hypothetical protein AAAC51_23275 [Priestia megaterium]
MLDWIVDNKVFSGFAGTALTILVGIIGASVKKKKDKAQPTQKITSGDSSNNIQGGNDVNITIGDKDDRS